MTYSVKEMFYTLQGEGRNAGRPAVFCRFSGCNLWTGREEDRHDAVCTFCDTDFIGVDGLGGGKFKTAQALAEAVRMTWPDETHNRPFVVCTGGEPLLQIDPPLISALHDCGFEIAVETNGTIPAPAGIDWICVSPKENAEVVQKTGHELKLVFPQDSIHPSDVDAWDFENFYLQPMDCVNRQENTQKAIDYCLRNPHWRLSLQTHKILNIP